MRTRSFLAMVLIPISTVGCRESSPPTVERADSAGVEIVHNATGDRTLEWSFTKVLSIGAEGSDDFTFSRMSAAADGFGNVYVLDRGNHRIVVFDSNGNHIRTMGRAGGGPGEFTLPVSFAVLPDGRVSAYDVSKHGLVNFEPDGSYLPEERVDAAYIGGRMARSPQLLAVTVSEVGSSPGTVLERLLEVEKDEVRELIRLERPGPVPITPRSCGITIQDLPPFFQPSLRWTLRDTAVIASRSASYVVDVVTRRGVRASYRRDVEPREASLALAVAEVGEAMRFGNRVCEATDIVEQVGYAPVIPTIVDLRVGPGGTIWVRRHTSPGEPSLIDIIDDSGVYLGTLPPGSPFPAAFLPGDRLVVEEVDDLSVETVAVYFHAPTGFES